MADTTATEKKIKTIIVQVCGCDERDISNDSPLIGIAANSLYLLEIIALIEEQFKIKLDEDQMSKLQTIDDILKYLTKHKKLLF